VQAFCWHHGAKEFGRDSREKTQTGRENKRETGSKNKAFMGESEKVHGAGQKGSELSLGDAGLKKKDGGESGRN